MSLINENECALLIIDVQEKLLNAVFNKSILAHKAEILAKTANILELPVIITEQYPQGLGKTIEKITSVLNENSQVFEKSSFSILDEEPIKQCDILQEKKQIMVFGIETHICVNHSVAALAENGYDVFVIADACGSRSEIEYRAGLNRMKEHGAHIITTEIALFELLKSARHPH